VHTIHWWPKARPRNVSTTTIHHYTCARARKIASKFHLILIRIVAKCSDRIPAESQSYEFMRESFFWLEHLAVWRCKNGELLQHQQEHCDKLCMSKCIISSDVVETATFETETWLKFRNEAETETSSKTPNRDSRLEVRDRDSKINAFWRNLKKCPHRFWLEFFSNFWHFSDVYSLFLTCKCNKQKIVE